MKNAKKTIISVFLAVCLILPLYGGLTAAGAASEAPTKLTIFGNLVPELKDSDKAVFQKLEEMTNTKLDIQIPPSSNYTEAITIMMASGDYPDLVLFPDQGNKAYLDGVRDGVILPVNDYIANAPSLMAYTYPVSWKSLKVMGDDNIYGIPRTSIARADGFLVRLDWLEKLGIPFEEGKPVTLDQFTAILKAFTENDPDGNGVKDTYGFTHNADDSGNLVPPDPIKWAFGVIGWQHYDNEPYEYMDLSYSKTNDSFKQMLSYMNMLWKNQYIDPDWPTNNNDTRLLRMDQGIAGVRAEFAGWMPDYEARAQAINPNAKLGYIVGISMGDSGMVTGGTFSTGFWGVWGVMATSKAPQKAVSVLDTILSDDFWPTAKYGLEGSAWQYDADGNMIAVPNSMYNAPRNLVRRNNDPGFFVGLATPVAYRQRVENLIGVCINQAVFSKNEGFRPAVSDDPTFIDAQKERSVTISKIIAGDLPLDAYDASLDKWYAAGGQTYIEQMNAGIAANQ